MVKLRDKTIHRSPLMIGIYIFILLSEVAHEITCIKQKRQLFREQLLPEMGGKIPESAFNPDRLILNRLNQQGISIPDGVLLHQRRQEKHPIPKEPLPETIKVVLMNDGRYVAPAGRYHFNKPPTVDTTYVIRIPHRVFFKGLQWNNIHKVPNVPQYNVVDVSKWVPPTWYNEVAKNKRKNNNRDITDPSQVLEEYSSYLQKLHRDYDK